MNYTYFPCENIEPSNDVSNWYFLERQKLNNNNVKHLNGEEEGKFNERRLDDDNKSAKSKTKDFLAAELSAMSKLSLYEGDIDKHKLDDE